MIDNVRDNGLLVTSDVLDERIRLSIEKQKQVPFRGTGCDRCHEHRHS